MARGQEALPPGDLFAYSAGFFRRGHVRRILELSGYRLRFGVPSHTGEIAVWGRTKYARRGHAVARWRDARLLTVEDAFLRSVLPGRSGAGGMGAVLDRSGIFFDTNVPSDLENILNQGDLFRPEKLARAARGVEALRQAGLSKYNAFSQAVLPEPGFVLIIDQTRNDASIRFGGADENSFRSMLTAARAEHPDARIVIKTHPETLAGHRRGYFSRQDCDKRTELFAASVSPWALFDRATAVYCVTSQMGFEAILAGHRPHVFGRPFYAGWGLSEDRQAIPRRARSLSSEALFAGAMLDYATWYDPYRDRLCDFETVVQNLAAQARAWREDAKGYQAFEIRLWKRRHFRHFFKDAGPRLVFARGVETVPSLPRPAMVWAGKLSEELATHLSATGQPVLRVEDGFLRSRGLGAELVPPLSMVVDDLGIYYDPRHESRLERSLAQAPGLSETALNRARELRLRVIAARLSKYNLKSQELPDFPAGRRLILVPGQVEDDASIKTGTGPVQTNRVLLQHARAANPDAILLFKPHPDVEAGLRAGAVEDAATLADFVVKNTDITDLLDTVDEVWTMTSLTGFEALLRGRQVTCLGAPFYAGWGLTRDLFPVPGRRDVTLSLDQMVHAVLIDYPRYFDPVTGLACPVEVVVDRLAAGTLPRGRANRALSKLQGVFASFAPVWR